MGLTVAASLGQDALADPEKRLQWLNSRMPAKTAAPKPETAPSTPAPVPAPKVGFRSNLQSVGTRKLDVEAPKVKEKPVAKTTPAEVRTTKTRTVETRPAKATPGPLARLATPIAVMESTPRTRSAQARSTPVPKSLAAPAITMIAPTRIVSTTTSSARSLSIEPQFPITTYQSSGSRRYPWKTSIVTTVFWVGEPPSGNNLTPNHASSWDLNWAANYGGFDNPDPAARRNFLPARFVPRLNPFYVALPYNDVTRGTTKPESRRVIPWFREAFVREGRSVCRDRWVAVRNRSGKVAYAQWSDCGPFRTDHWQYVFGSERPKPNLNKGAGLDVSPAVRDYLGLQGTDVTDWKFVEFADVPPGPWALHGQNNTFVQRGVRPKSRSIERTADTSPRKRVTGL